MDNLWNEINLQPPAIVTLPVKDSKLDLKNLRKILDNALKFYENQKDFNETAALCSRLIARRKNSFKRMSGFKDMCKTNSALCRILRIDIKQILTNFIGMLPEYISKVIDTYLPSVSCFEYVLIRLISLQKVLQRVLDCTENASTYFVQILNYSYFQDIVILYLAVLSKIWKLSQLMMIRTAYIYENLLKYKSDFPQSKKPWGKINFPEKLDIPQAVLEKLSQKQDENEENDQQNKSKTVINFISSLTQAETNFKISKEFNKLHKKIDLGTIINRDTFNKQPVQKLNPQFQKLKSIDTVEEIRHFFTEEDQQRRKSIKQSITKNISSGEWISIKKSINNKIIANDTSKAIKLFESFVENKILH